MEAEEEGEMLHHCCCCTTLPPGHACAAVRRGGGGQSAETLQTLDKNMYKLSLPLPLTILYRSLCTGDLTRGQFHVALLGV